MYNVASYLASLIYDLEKVTDDGNAIVEVQSFIELQSSHILC